MSAITVLRKRYPLFWKKYKKIFAGRQTPITQREKISDAAIPYVEYYDCFSANTEILFVGSNPSGTDSGYYKANNPSNSEIIEYNNIRNTRYYKEYAKIADRIGVTESKISVMDLFGIVQSKQSVIENDYAAAISSSPNPYTEMIQIFLEVVKELKPKIIIVANAFVRRVLLSELQGRMSWDCGYGGYHLIVDGFCAKVYFTSMLYGNRALDQGNRENLVWIVQRYLNKP